MLQIGKEVTYGTEVPATRILRIDGLRWNDQSSQRLYTPNYSIGRMTRRTDVPTVTRTGLANSSYETDFSFEDVLFPLLAGFKGGVTSSEKTAMQDDREWIFQNDPNTGDVLPDSYTLERRLSNGSTHWDSLALGTLVESFEISADSGGDMTRLTVNFWSRAPVSTGFTTGLSLLTPFTPLPALSWRFGIDNTWAAMDVTTAIPSYDVGTEISTTVKSFTFRYFTGVAPALYIGDGRTDPSKHKTMPRGAELELSVEYNATIDTERTKAAAGSKRYIRLLGEGARIGTGFNFSCLIQGAYVYPDGGFGEVGAESDGAETMTLRLESLPDDDTEDLEIKVINQENSFPV
jgi:hypothetical protein